MKIDRARAQRAFADYAAHYNTADPKVKLKIDHTYRVAALCSRIAESLSLPQQDIDLAWLSGILHDVGRFEQLRRYNTFMDAQSVSHAALSVSVLFDEGHIRDYLDDTNADSLLRALSERAVGALTAAAATLPGSVLAVATCVLALFFTSASYPELCSALERSIPQIAMQKLLRLRDGVMRSLARWLRAQATLSLITFSELLAGFLLIRQRYSLLLAFLITLLDALPVFGTGTALVPWALVTLLFGFPPRAIVLLALYLCTLITRNTLEPRLLSAQAGLPPVASLFAMYLGYCTFGIAGMVLFPFFLLLLSQIRNTRPEKA